MSKHARTRLTKAVLGIDTNARYAHQPKDLEERARAVLGPATAYAEEEPTVTEWLRELVPTRAGVAQYLRTLFPPLFWIPRYNCSWLLGDAVAGMHRKVSVALYTLVADSHQASLLVWSSSHKPWPMRFSPTLPQRTASTRPLLVPSCTGSLGLRKISSSE